MSVCVYSMFALSCVCVQVAALRRADPPSKESADCGEKKRNLKAAKVKESVVEPKTDKLKFRLPRKHSECSYRATGSTTYESGFCSLQESRISLFSTASSPALGPTQPPVQWVTGARFP
jgi:hypothetical protein